MAPSPSPTTTTKKPSILIINGSFSSSPFYSKTSTLLTAAGYEVAVADYPSIRNRGASMPAASMADDAAHVSALLQGYVERGEEVLVVAHSYGGVPASEGMKGVVTKEGRGGRVVGILYVAALTPGVGQSLSDLMGEGVAPFLSVEGDYMILEPEGNARVNYSDMPFAEGLAWAKLQPQHSTLSFGGELSYAGYKDVPVSYLHTLQDLVVTPVLQKECMDIMNNARGDDESVTVIELDSGHFPFLSRPEETSRIIRKVAGEQIQL